MNARDSEKLEGILAEIGYEMTDDEELDEIFGNGDLPDYLKD